MKGPEPDKKKVPKLNLDFKSPNEYSVTPKVNPFQFIVKLYRQE